MIPRSVLVLFIQLAFIVCAAFAVADEAFANTDCKPVAIARWVQVVYAHNGDTLRLEDGTEVRAIGLNTPKLARDTRLDEPLAARARDTLHRLAGNRVGLEYDEQRKDRHGRMLAHVYSESQDNLAAQLIAEGLAHAVTYPPNVKHRDCYQQAEKTARAVSAGVWSHPYFEPVAAGEVNRGGFMRVKGCVKSTRNYRKTVALNLSAQFRLKIRRADLDGVLKPIVRPGAGDSLPNFSGACMIVRGWVKNDKASGRKTLPIRHPDDVETIIFP